MNGIRTNGPSVYTPPDVNTTEYKIGKLAEYERLIEITKASLRNMKRVKYQLIRDIDERQTRSHIA